MINKKRYFEWSVVFAVLVFSEWFFFRNIIGTGKGALLGDAGDGRLTMLLTEHWWNFFTGKEQFSELAMFYPAKEAIGYTDLFLGYGIVHSFFRLMGFDMYIAYKFTILSIHCFGTVSMYYLLRKKMAVASGWALFGTIAFSFSSTYARNLGNTQIAAISILPLLLIFLIGFFQHIDVRKKRNIYAYLFIGLFVLLAYTSWYVAFFTGLYVLVFLIIYFIKLKQYKLGMLGTLKEKIKYIGIDFLGYTIYLIVLFIPFIKIYVPVLQTTGGYVYDRCVEFLPEFVDIINVSTSNWLLGGVIIKLGLQGRYNVNAAAESGFSIILLLLFFITMIVMNRNKKVSVTTCDNCFVIMSATFWTVIVCIALTIRLSNNGVSLWMAVYYFIPMARGIRAVGRFLLWLSFPMAVITVVALDKYICFKGNKKCKSIFMSAALIILFVSNIDKIAVSSGWNAEDERSFLDNVAEPPEDVQCFYIIDSAKTEEPLYCQLDAFEIANRYHIKTINGYSGQWPENWWEIGMWDVCSDEYENAVYQWVEENGLDHVYAYDKAANVWISFEDRFN